MGAPDWPICVKVAFGEVSFLYSPNQKDKLFIVKQWFRIINSYIQTFFFWID